MTDPGFADRTYIEPLDLEGHRRAAAGAAGRAAAHARRPDGPQPRRRARDRRRAPGGRRGAPRGADRRHPARGGPSALPRRRAELQAAVPVRIVESAATSQMPLSRQSSVPRSRSAATAGGSRRRSSCAPRWSAAWRADRPGARRGVDPRLGRVRARGDPRPRRQRRGRPARSRTSARWVSIPATPSPWRRSGLSQARRTRTRGGAVTVIRAVGVETEGRTSSSRDAATPAAAGDRDDPRVSRSSALASKATGYPIAKVAAKLAVGLQRRDPERPHEDDSRELQADPRLRGGEVPALRVREVPGADPTLGTR